MKKYFSVFLVFILTSITFSQVLDEQYFKENHEVYFKFNISERAELRALTNVISIDNIEENTVYAYANENEFREFEKLNYPYTVLTHPSKLIEPEMSSDIEGITAWDVYPTYDAYINMMYLFQLNYPNLCRIVDAGNTVQGRKILFAVISDNVTQRETEPQFMYTSSMHGDELTGYVLMLRLIDSLLATYGTDARITQLVNNAEIWINPLANPDGTYRSGNNTVSGATRYNYNNYDLNRNFPDPILGVNPNQQIETTRFRNIAETNNFALVANFHGGTEVVNYPWDTWTNTPPDNRHHPDEAWYQYISHLYADTCQANSPSNYMNGYDDGITNGGDWYVISYGRQDYTNYYRWGREVTIEISDTKLIPAAQLPAHWYYNRKSFLNYMETVLKGVNGIVTDTLGNPVKAKITVINHDADNSEVFSDSIGYYLRMLSPGTYTFKFEAPNYYTQTISNVVVSSYNSLTVLNVQLVSSIIPVELISFTSYVDGVNVTLNWRTATEINNMGFEIERKSPSPTPSLKEGTFEFTDWKSVGFVNGNGTTTQTKSYSFLDEGLSSGKYQYRLKQIDFDGSFDYSNIIDAEIISPIKLSLEQNFPNPFNPTTLIRYSVPNVISTEGRNLNVILKVFDVLGNEVATLVNEIKPAGNYNVEFNAKNLSSGVYFYQLKAGSLIQTKKMILLQ
ncbi:MAG: carboxypeptidase regulatory-like domain-containing protein [Ignavibacteriaceae bacterium]|nr:carboxypeptidase regulatory-like domain-containing protein [Ignavibacteriaceae bacterium]HRN27981.1 M14 family zinc carboxypeptidase [Ignavibacteriaceae bacterium]HRQ55702.1 M14 family zinc carboxypeptidase [Ignavibacteriaceae bacterium]